MEFKSGENFYDGVDTFTVVRDPYSRMVSEYYYFFQSKQHLVKKWGVKAPSDLNDPGAMNKWIINATETAMKQGECYGGHCQPLHRFAFSKGKQIVTHILKMEELSETFQPLMDQYQLPVKLEHHNSRTGGTNLGVKDLSEDAIAKINEWAGPDFDLFGYEKLDPSNAKKGNENKEEWGGYDTK